MKSKIFNYLEIAAMTAKSKEDKRSYLLGAVGIRNDGALVKALNSPTESPNRQCHSEYRLAKKLDRGATVYVARVRIDNGAFGMARPCPSCQKILTSRGVLKVYYSIDKNTYGVWSVKDNTDKTFNF
jgi:tRNA(Arg) A34 adenosine deaminase TadA